MPTTYSDDTDLRKYLSEGDYAALPVPLSELHEEVGRQINQYLVSLGYTTETIALLTDDSLASLREASALRVLQLFFLRYEDSSERAKSFGALYGDAVTNLSLGTSSGSETAVGDGIAVLG